MQCIRLDFIPKFPLELSTKIFCLFDLTDLKSCSLVSSIWNKRTEDEKIWCCKAEEKDILYVINSPISIKLQMAPVWKITVVKKEKLLHIIESTFKQARNRQIASIYYQSASRSETYFYAFVGEQKKILNSFKMQNAEQLIKEFITKDSHIHRSIRGYKEADLAENSNKNCNFSFHTTFGIFYKGFSNNQIQSIHKIMQKFGSILEEEILTRSVMDLEGLSLFECLF